MKTVTFSDEVIEETIRLLIDCNYPCYDEEIDFPIYYKKYKKSIGELLELKNHHLVLLLEDKLYTGYALYTINYEIGMGQYIFNLLNICIVDHLRGSGRGKFLLESLINQAIELKCAKIILNTNITNSKAIDFYKKIGFRILNKEYTFCDKPLV